MIAKVVRFGDFQLDFRNYELRRAGQSLKLRRQQMELLRLLTERAGLLVTRQEMADRLWGANPPAEIKQGIDNLVSKLRRTLGDELANHK